MTVGWLVSAGLIVLGGWLLIKNAAKRVYVQWKVAGCRKVVAEIENPAAFHAFFIGEMEALLSLLERRIEISKAILVVGVFLTVFLALNHWGLVNLG